MQSVIFSILFLTSLQASAAFMVTANDCSDMEVYDTAMGMCMPVAMDEMSMSMFMIHGNAFLVGDIQSGPRARDAVSAPNMMMFDAGTTLGSRHYLNLDFMGSVERWTTPDLGYPEFLQIGEDNSQGLPYIDAQHPHNSPVMGLTLSDTISFGQNKNYLKLFVAPRGEATDGPIAFMHRPTGMVNPDAPLGHHIGQDVGHISSTVLGESLKLNDTILEFSTYHGAEPSPTKVDLPLGSLDSYSWRWIQNITSQFKVMASFAYVSGPEADDPDISFELRYSASIYNTFKINDRWKLENAFIFGTVTNYDHAASLSSFAEEFWIHSDANSQYWGRIEYLQRTPAELQIVSSSNSAAWVSALTLGYTQILSKSESTEIGLGGSVTSNLLPVDFQSVYGGNPWTGRLFLQLSGMKML